MAAKRTGSAGRHVLSTLHGFDWEFALRDAPTGFAIGSRDRDDVERQGGAGSSTYGELMPDAARQLLLSLDLGPDDVLFDLGSGAGRFVIQAVCESNIGHAVGVELSRDRHAVATHAVNRIAAPPLDPDSRSELSRRLELRHEDLRRTDLSTATHVYLPVTSFPRSLIEAACRHLWANAPRLRVLVSTIDLPEPWNQRFPTRAVLELDMTWANRVRVFVRDARA